MSKKMEFREVKIQMEGEKLSMEIKGFSAFELLGVLRFYEKSVWLQILNHQSAERVQAENAPAIQKTQG